MLKFLVACIIYFVSFAFCVLIINKLYQKSTYFQITKKPLMELRKDKGSYGEYLIYKKLRKYEKNYGGKFLFNCYLPKENGETTEIDVLLILKSGIYVFESKNYSGWIFGDSRKKIWTQVLPQGSGKAARKEHFANPIFQNELHIHCLENYLKRAIPMFSIISFSERCTFKEIDIGNYECAVVYNTELPLIVKKINEQAVETLSEVDIDRIYKVLYPLTQVSEFVKQQHIIDINNKIYRQSTHKKQNKNVRVDDIEN